MLGRRTIGLNYSGRNAIFCTWAPFAKSVALKCPDGTYELKRTQYGFWESNEFYIEPGTSYSIILDGKKLQDPASLFQPSGVNGDSVAFNLHAHKWKDVSWTGIALEDLIIYELHTGTFSHEGTFEAIANRIEYLRDLGITAIELMPVAQFSGSRNWGYDGVFPYAVQNSYGGPAALQELVDKCHRHEIAVILDVVLNHIGPEGNILPLFGPFFTSKYKTPWGDAINYDDTWCDGVRMFFTENILMWMRDFHIDGIRLDAVHAVKDFSPVNILQEIHENVTVLNAHTSARHFLIGECDLNDIRYINAVHKGGYGLDAIWNDEFHHALHAWITAEAKGYYSDYGKMWHLVKAFNDAFVYDGIWSEHRKKIFGTRTSGFDGGKFVVFSQNHDQIGNRMMGDRLSASLSLEKLKLIAGAVLFSPFIPLIFMGEEYAETNPFQYFTSHSDIKLIRMVRKGRKKEFEAFIQEGRMPDPQDENTFERSKLNQSDVNSRQKALFNFYKILIQLRKSIPLWKSMDRSKFKAESIEGRNVLQLIRKDNRDTLLAIFNFEETESCVNSLNPYNKWDLLLNSGDKVWGGPGNNFEPEKLSIPPQTLVILYGS